MRLTGALAAAAVLLLHACILCEAWQEWLSPGPVPGPRYGHSVHVHGNYTYVFGGRYRRARVPSYVVSRPRVCSCSEWSDCVLHVSCSSVRVPCPRRSVCAFLATCVKVLLGRVRGFGVTPPPPPEELLA